MTAQKARVYYAALVLVLAVASAFLVQRHHRHWYSDTYDYMRLMFVARGESTMQADEDSWRFFALSTDPDRRASCCPTDIHNPDAKHTLDRARIVYPYLAAILYPAFGAAAFIVVSAVAYVIAVLLVYALLLEFAPPPIAVVGSLVFATQEWVRQAAAAALTDALGLCLWTAILLAFVRMARSGDGRWLLVIGLGTLALTFTRPVLFLPGGAAIAALAVARRPRVWQSVAALALLVLVAGIYSYATAVGAAPGILEQLRWMHKIDVTPAARLPLLPWFATAVRHTLADEIERLQNGLGAVVLLAAVGWWGHRRDPAVAPVVGGAIGEILALVVNPSPWDIVRTFETPLWPSLLVGLSIVVSDAAKIWMSERGRTIQA